MLMNLAYDLFREARCQAETQKRCRTLSDNEGGVSHEVWRRHSQHGTAIDARNDRCMRPSSGRRGFDAAFVVDHLAIPPDQTEGSGGRYLDPLTTLGYLAGITTRIRLGISVLVIPYRPAVLTAKQVATLQELSGERIILGAGVGWMRQEFEVLGVDPRKRGALTDETLQILHTLFANDVNSYDGKLVKFPPFVFAPRPARPPIWIGGSGPKALERTLRFGDAYYPIGFKPDELTQIGTYLREEAQKRDRPAPELIVGGMIREGEGGTRKYDRSYLRLS